MNYTPNDGSDMELYSFSYTQSTLLTPKSWHVVNQDVLLIFVDIWQSIIGLKERKALSSLLAFSTSIFLVVPGTSWPNDLVLKDST